MIRRFLCLGLLAVLCATALAETVAVSSVLRLGPAPLPLPAFHDADTQGVSLDDLATVATLDVPVLRPRAGASVAGWPGQLTWQTVEDAPCPAPSEQRARRGLAGLLPPQRPLARGWPRRHPHRRHPPAGLAERRDRHPERR